MRIEPDRAYTNGDNAAELMAAYAFALDPWQREVLDCWLGRDAQSRLTAMTCGLSCPRQNGKNAIIEAFEFFLLLNVRDTHILHTAHQVRTSKRAFNRLAGIFSDNRHPELMEQVGTIRRTNGEERIELTNGNTIEYSARSRSAARGFDAISVVVYDEAQELTGDQVEALMATLAASPTGDRQVVYAGTPPGPTCPGEVFRMRRAAALEEPTPRTAWHEWSVEELPPRSAAFADVVEAVYETNPAMGLRLDEEFTREEFATMAIDGFARERLGWWSPVEGFRAALDASAWRKGTVEGSPDGKRAFGIRFSADGTRCAVCVAVLPESGRAHIEMIYDENITGVGIGGIADMAEQMAATASLVAVDGRGSAEALITELGARGAPKRSYCRAGTREAVAASAMLVDAVREGNITHLDDPGLSESVRKSSKRPIGTSGGFGFGGERPEPVEAAALALWAVRTGKRDPNRKLRIG